MSVPILDASAWREFRGKPANSGRNQTTHMAKVADVQGKLHDCYVKLLPTDTPALLCEAIGWLLASKSDVACPSFGAILLVPVKELRKCTPLSAEFDRMTLCPAWCSEVVSGKTVKQIHTMAYFVARKNCLRSKDVRKIAAFDQWSDLRDRNFGNVIASAKGGYVAIDHETLLHDLLWIPAGRNYTEWSLLNEAKSTLDSAGVKKFQVDMANAAKGHAKALMETAADLAAIVAQLQPANAASLSQSIHQTLDARSQPDWLSNKLGVIA
jgi:hypothetical protein